MGISTSFKHDKVSIRLAAERIPSIVDALALHCNMSRDTLLGKSRAPEIVQARHILFTLLQAAGNSCSTVARYLCLNHSTVLHGVHKVEDIPALQKEYQRALLKVMPAMFPLDEALRRVTDRLGVMASAAFAYLWVDLLGKALKAVSQAARRVAGLWAIISDSALLTQVREILAAHDEVGAVWLLDKHTHQYAFVRV